MKGVIYKKVISLFGFLFFILGILAVINSLLNPEIANFLWLCYISLILIGLGMFLRNSFLIVLQLNIITIPLIFWNIDFFYQLIVGQTLFGVTDYLFEGGLNSLGNFITLQHIYILPLAFYSIYKIGFKRKNLWVFSFIEIIFIFLLSVFFLRESNTNCAFESCVNFISISGWRYSFLWFVVGFAVIFLVNYILTKVFVRG